MIQNALLVSALRRDTWIVFVTLALVIALAWGYLFTLATDMDMSGMDMSAAAMAAMMAPSYTPWTVTYFGFMLTMWSLMMVGMMLPSATPMILLYARVGAKSMTLGRPFAAAGWFAGGYLGAWFAFSLFATAAQWLLEKALLLDPMMASASRLFNGIALVVIGVYQWTPLKQACLAHCQAPLSFVQRHGGFRGSARGSLRLGLLHGLYCVGCCWALMVLLFVGGVMNVLWILAITILVLLEKIIPGTWLPRLVGIGFVAAGVWLLAARQPMPFAS